MCATKGKAFWSWWKSLEWKVKCGIKVLVHENNLQSILLGDVWSRKFWDYCFKAGKHFKPHCVSVHFQQASAKLREKVLHWLRIRKDVENACRRWMPLLQITVPQKHRDTPWNSIWQTHSINGLHCLVSLGFCLKQLLGAADYFTKCPRACLLAHQCQMSKWKMSSPSKS